MWDLKPRLLCLLLPIPLLFACPDSDDDDDDASSTLEPGPIPTCELAWSTAGLDFGEVALGEADTLTATLEAAVDTECVVSQLNVEGVGGVQFVAESAEPLPFTLAEGGYSVEVTVTFSPSTNTSYAANLVARAAPPAPGNGTVTASLALSGSGGLADTDGDGVDNGQDNCVDDPNADQADADADGLGDVCDPCPTYAGNDADGDGLCGDVDNCPDAANDAQTDTDGDGIGDACDICVEDADNDIDRDSYCAEVDNCPLEFNHDQVDADKDGAGDACDPCPADADNDVDGDGVCGDEDSCPVLSNPGQTDQDGDGLGDECDACPLDPDNDVDADGVCGDADNCPVVSNSEQTDQDNDGLGDACDPCPDDSAGDVDGDGVCNEADNCSTDPNSDQADQDNDGQGDVCDPCPLDPDNDGDQDTFCSDVDNCPADANADQADRDGDGGGDVCDACPDDPNNDVDGDTLCGDVDNCPTDANSDQADGDGDGLGDACDACPSDSDNDVDEDSICGDVDNCPADANTDQSDQDHDGLGDVCDACPLDPDNDIDVDNVCGDIDNCPDAPNLSQQDTDADGVGDVCDAETCDGLDNDGDGSVDEDFPDADGIGGVDCSDFDGDGFTEQGVGSEPGDCNDEDASVFPGATEFWHDGVDSDCSGNENPDPCVEFPPFRTVMPREGCDEDLEVRVYGICEVDCDSQLEIVAEVINYGATASPEGLEMVIYGVTTQGGYSQLSVEIIDPVAAESSSGGLVFDVGGFDELYFFPSIVLSLDDDQAGGGMVEECDEDNNRDEAYTSDSECPAPDVCDVPPPGFPVPFDLGCMYVPTVGTFEPVIEWQKSSFTIAPSYYRVMVTPVVGNLTDDNGDGRVDELDVPDIVFTTFSGGSYSSAGYLRAISGDDGSEIFGVPGACASAGVALGDADGDGFPEIYTATCGGYLISFDRFGVERWTCPGYANTASYPQYAYPAIADLEGDGDAEILLGSTVCDDEGNTVVSTVIRHSHISWFQDVDQDGTMEIVSGYGISRADGSTLWAGPGGYGAMADFDGDPFPELVNVSGGTVSLWDDDGTRIWSASIPQGGGGPPTIADFDGDGEPEIGAAGAYNYAVFETNGSLKWQRTVQDTSSSVTGSSVYDFDGDGSAEVVYADEIDLWVFDGATGDVLLRQPGHANWTLWEYPVVADVDKDGHAEIILASNDGQSPGWNGITVLGDRYNNWVTARPVWNQHAYHITNINDDLSVPQHQVPNWIDGNNTFRQGGVDQSGVLVAPDLIPYLVSECFEGCPSSARVLFQVENRGINSVGAGLPYALYAEDIDGYRTLVAYGTVADPIPPGWASGTIDILVDPAEIGNAALVLSVDDDGTGVGIQNECQENNNVISLPPLCE